MLREGIYLDSAATTHKPRAVIDAISHFYSHDYATIHRSVYGAADRAADLYATVRAQVAHFIGAKHSDEIVFVRGATDALNLLAYSFPRAFMQPGDEIVISEWGHHANIVPWQTVARERGLTLKVVPIDGDFADFVTEKTALISVPHIANATGDALPVAEIVALARRVGAKVIVDGAQVAGHRKIDVAALDADFYLFSGHKMYGPTGIGVLYGKAALLAELPPYQTGGDMVEEVSLETATFQKPPLRFEAGTPLLSGVIGLGAAIAYIEKIGIDNIARWEHHIMQHAEKELSAIPGLHILGHQREGSIVSFVIDGCHPLDLATLLSVKGIAVRSGTLCAQPAVKALGYDSVIRASFGLYTLPEEITALAEALKSSLALL